MPWYESTEFDIFYISFDEPDYKKNYADLLLKAPWAQHVHGVVGFDNAHKECARRSSSERFISVDGDNIVDEVFFDRKILIEPEHKESIFSWSSKNHVNGLIYGNGGLKLWPVDVTLNMKTHENSEVEAAAVDFCWDLDYRQMNDVYCTNYVNGSPYQSFRAGFREGVKMSLADGKKVPKDEFEKSIWHKNYVRLLIWASVGADVKNGLWSVYGTRLGCYLCNLDPEFNHHNIRDYNWFTDFFSTLEITEETLDSETTRLGEILRKELGMQIPSAATPEWSEFFKRTYTNPPRVGINISEKWMQEKGFK